MINIFLFQIQNKSISKNIQNQNIDNKGATITNQSNYQFTITKISPEKPQKSITDIKYQIPDPVESFRGRQKELKEIDEYFKKNKIVVISGIGGIGKTELAINYVDKYQNKYEKNIIWINGETEKDLKSSFEGIAKLIDKNTQEFTSVTVENVYSYFGKSKCIFIIDNAENRQSINDFLPKKISHANMKLYVLITSQYSKWDDIPIVLLDNLSQNATLEIIHSLLKTFYKEQDKKYWLELAEFLNYIPLALQIAVSHVREEMEACEDFFDFQEYINQLKEEAENNFINQNFPVSSANKYNKTLYSAVKISVDKIKNNNSPESQFALEILYIMAYLYPNYIEYDLFLILDKAKKSKSKVLKSIFILTKYSFIKKLSSYNRVYNIHRLIQLLVRCYQKQNDIMRQYLHFALNTTVTTNDKHWSWHESSIFTHCEQNFDIIACHYLGNLKSISNRFIQCLMYYNCLKSLEFIFSKEKNEAVQELIYSQDLFPFAIKNGTVELFVFLLRYRDCDVNKKYDDRGRTLLHFAAERMDTAKIKMLMKLGACTNVTDGKGFTVLHAVLNSWKILNENENKAMECLNILMENGQLDVNALDKNGRSPLFYATENLLLKCMRWLIMQKSRANIIGKEGVTPLRPSRKLWRNENGDKVLECLNILIQTGQVDVNDLGRNGRSLLFYAAKLWLPKCMKCLLKGGANVDIADHLHEIMKTGILYTDEDNIVEFLNLLIDIGLADFNVVDKMGCTPLFYAAEKLNMTYIKCLIERKARVDIANQDGVTPLLALVKTSAIKIEDEDKIIECLNILTDFGQADVNALDKKGRSALIYAAERCYLKCMKWLIEHNAQVCVADKTGNTPMNVLFNFFDSHYSFNPQNIIQIGKLLLKHGATIPNNLIPASVKCRELQVVRWLVEDFNCDINVQDARGNTALHHLACISYPYAATIKLQEICTYLLKKGADCNVVDKMGCTPLFYAAETLNVTYIKCLIERKARVDIANQDGVTPLLALIKTSAINIEDEDKIIECLNILTDFGQADVNALDKKGRSALIYAAERCYLKCMKWLIEHNVQVCVTDKIGNTPMNVLFNSFDIRYSFNPQNIIEVGKLLLKHGDTISNNLLPASVKCRELQVVRWLVEEFNCDINAQDAKGNTALHHLACIPWPYAVTVKLREICTYLLKKGADWNIKNATGDTAIQFIENYENKFLLECFKEFQ